MLAALLDHIEGPAAPTLHNATNNVKNVHWSVLHRVYDRRLSQSSGAGRGTKDAEDVTTGDAPGARDAPGAHDRQPERRRQAAPSARDAPGAQGQQPGAKTIKTRDKNVTRPLGPDVVDKGQP